MIHGWPGVDFAADVWLAVTLIATGLIGFGLVWWRTRRGK